MKYYITNNPEMFPETSEMVLSDLDSLVDFMAHTNIIGVDTETEGEFNFINNILLVQIGDEVDQYVIDVTSVDILSEPYIKEYLQNPCTVKILQNAKFDYQFLKYQYDIELENVFDTMLSEVVLNCGKEQYGYGLALIVKRYCNVDLDKSVRERFSKKRVGTFTLEELIYAATDVEYLTDIREQQLVEAERIKVRATIDLENETVLAFSDMEYNGMKLDTVKWLEIAEKTGAGALQQVKILDDIILGEPSMKKYHQYQHDMYEPTPRLSINWSSPKQVLSILQSLKIPVTSTNSDELVLYEKNHPLVSELIEYKKQTKLANAFGKDFLKFVNPVTKRIHPSFWQILNTGRVSCKEPNLQQIPSKGDLGKEMRSAFISEPGRSIVGGDYSGCELRIIAHGSKDPVWMKEFLGEGKVHDKVACMMFGIEMDEVRDCPDWLHGASYRDVAKTIDFGLAYGMSKFKLASTLQIDVAEADKLITKFFTTFPKIKEFLTRLGKFGKDNGYIKTYSPYKRIRWFDNWHKDMKHDQQAFKLLGAIERASKNTPIQGTNADITKAALVAIRDAIKFCPGNIKLINTIHDEILTEVDDFYAETWKNQMEVIMQECAEEVVTSIPMNVDCTISKFWTK